MISYVFTVIGSVMLLAASIIYGSDGGSVAWQFPMCLALAAYLLAILYKKERNP